MKYGQLVEYNKGNIFLQNDTKTEAWSLVPDLFLFLEIFIWGKSKWFAGWF